MAVEKRRIPKKRRRGAGGSIDETKQQETTARIQKYKTYSYRNKL